MTEHRESSEPVLIVAVVVTVLVCALVFGFGSNIADRFFGPDEAKIRQQCIERVVRSTVYSRRPSASKPATRSTGEI